MPLVAGSRLDSYEILAPLGAGGMGEVYRARDATLKRDVAIKVLPEYWSRDPERLHRFEQEARATATLNHPNILAVYQMATHEGVSYMVTELLDGETLRESLRRGPVPIRKAIDYAVQSAHGLAAAHDKGITHRDLKPDNLFVTKDGRVKILDFGLAKVGPSKDSSDLDATVAHHTEPGMVMGTAGYMSPEQVRGKPADHRSDIFAFGTILYEMVTGKQTFRKPTSAETMAAILNEEPPSISQVTATAPPGLQRVVHRCLEKSPEQRFQSASDMAFALEALSDSWSSAGSANNQGARPRWRWIAATATVVAIAAALIAWWRTPPAVPVVESVTQLTDDGEAKTGRLVSDGSRVYFDEGPSGSSKIAQVSVTGGHTGVIDTKLVSPKVAGLGPDGADLLALVGGYFEFSNTGWSIPLPAGEPRRLGGDEITDASYFPDGRLLLIKENDLYVADKDGSNPRKLLSVADRVWDASVSPDGKHIVFGTNVGDHCALVEIAPDGTGLRAIVNAGKDECLSNGVWSADGTYIVYQVDHGRGSDLWAFPMRTGLLQRSSEAIRLTNGPLAYSGARPSPDGKQIFAIGTKRRGELVRYDSKSHEYVPFLSGISAIDPTFSRDGQWVAYTSYPDHTLWRSRSDGSERLQLTYPPMAVGFSFISPDATRVAFTTSQDEIYVIDMQGGTPRKIAEKHSNAANWSPDGSFLVMTAWKDAPGSNRHSFYSQVADLRTGKISVVPASEGTVGVAWVTQDMLVASTEDRLKFVTFDFKTQQWSDLVTGRFVNWPLSTDRKYLYFTTGGADPKVQRLRFADRQIETITSLKDLRRVVDPVERQTQMQVTPDGSPDFTRDIGSQEIYALTIKWP